MRYPLDRDLSSGYVIQFWPSGAWLVSLTQGEERRRNIEIRKNGHTFITQYHSG